MMFLLIFEIFKVRVIKHFRLQLELYRSRNIYQEPFFLIENCTFTTLNVTAHTFFYVNYKWRFLVDISDTI